MSDLEKEPTSPLSKRKKIPVQLYLYRWLDNNSVNVATKRTDQLVNNAKTCNRYSEENEREINVLTITCQISILKTEKLNNKPASSRSISLLSTIYKLFETYLKPNKP